MASDKPERIGNLLSFIRDRGGDDSAFMRMLEVREAEVATAAQRRRARSRSLVLRASGIDVTAEDILAIAEDRLGGVECDEACATFRARHEDTRDCRDYHCDNLVRRWLTRASAPVGGPVPQFLALCGPTGIGKTVAAAWAIAEVGQGIAISSTELMQARKERAAALWGARILVLDDLGTEQDEPGKFASALYDLINKRQRERWMLTLITSNLSRTALVARYDARTVQRIRHRGYIADVLGRDMRRGME